MSEMVSVTCDERVRTARGIGIAVLFAVLILVLVLVDMYVGKQTVVDARGHLATHLRVFNAR